MRTRKQILLLRESHKASDTEKEMMELQNKQLRDQEALQEEEKKRKRAEEEASALQAEIDRIREEKARLKEQLDAEKSELQKSESQWKQRAEALAMTVSIYEGSLVQTRNELKKEREDSKLRMESETELAARLQTLEKEKSELAKEIGSIRSQWSEAEARLKRTQQQQIEGKDQEIEQLKQLNRSLEKAANSGEMEMLQSELQEQRKVSQRAEASLHSVEEKYEFASNQVEKLKKEILGYQDQLSKLRLQTEILEAEKNGIEQSVRQESEQRKEHEQIEKQRLAGIVESQEKSIAELKGQLEQSQ